MADTATTRAAVPSDGGPGFPRRLVAALAVTQTVGYGVLFYTFPVLLVPLAADLRAPAAAVTGALTVAIVVVAAAAIPAGRWLDRHGGRTLLTSGSVLGVVAVVAWSQVEHLWQLYAVFVLIGLAGAAVTYEAAFPVLIAECDPRHRNRALLAVTVIAGFSSSIFFPLTGLLTERLGWRGALLVLAALLGVVTVPLHAAFVPDRRSGREPRPRSADGASVRQAVRERGFWLLAAAFVAQAAAVSAVGVLLVAALRQLGHPATVAATLAGLLGVLSVTGRLVTTGAARRYGMTTVTATVFAVQALGVLALPQVGRTVAGAAVCVIAFGLGFGVAAIARPIIVADRFGTVRYATIAGSLAAPVTLAKAFAPLGAAAVSTTAFLLTASALCLLSAGLLWGTRR
jgi:MFS family permease